MPLPSRPDTDDLEAQLDALLEDFEKHDADDHSCFSEDRKHLLPKLLALLKPYIEQKIGDAYEYGAWEESMGEDL